MNVQIPPLFQLSHFTWWYLDLQIDLTALWTMIWDITARSAWESLPSSHLVNPGGVLNSLAEPGFLRPTWTWTSEIWEYLKMCLCFLSPLFSLLLPFFFNPHSLSSYNFSLFFSIVSPTFPFFLHSPTTLNLLANLSLYTTSSVI